MNRYISPIPRTFVSLLLGACVLSSGAWVAPAFSAPEKATPAPMAGQKSVQNSVNINTATAEVLAAKLVGIGQKKAEAIVAYREQQGAFKTAEGLLGVKGIGESTLAKNRARIVL